MPPASVTFTVQWVPPCLTPTQLWTVRRSIRMIPGTPETQDTGCCLSASSVETGAFCLGLHFLEEEGYTGCSGRPGCHIRTPITGPSQQSPFLGETGSACQAVCRVSTSCHSEASAKLTSPQWGAPGPWPPSPWAGPFSFSLSQLRLQPLGGDPTGCLSGLPGARDLSV